MGVNIYIPPDDVWKFFLENKSRLSEEMVTIAENTNTEYVVYLTEDSGYPLFSVCRGRADPEFEESAINESDCARTTRCCYAKYLYPVSVVDNDIAESSGLFDDDYSFGEQDEQDAVYEREDELCLALAGFLQVVLRDNSAEFDIIDMYGKEMFTELLDIILDQIAQDGFSIYRPMFLADPDTGEEIYTEYPYEINP